MNKKKGVENVSKTPSALLLFVYIVKIKDFMNCAMLFDDFVVIGVGMLYACRDFRIKNLFFTIEVVGSRNKKINQVVMAM